MSPNSRWRQNFRARIDTIIQRRVNEFWTLIKYTAIRVRVHPVSIKYTYLQSTLYSYVQVQNYLVLFRIILIYSMQICTSIALQKLKLLILRNEMIATKMVAKSREFVLKFWIFYYFHIRVHGPY